MNEKVSCHVSSICHVTCHINQLNIFSSYNMLANSYEHLEKELPVRLAHASRMAKVQEHNVSNILSDFYWQNLLVLAS